MLLVIQVVEKEMQIKQPSSATAQDGFLLVTKVVDGDTFWADDGTK
jgi:hypothetical protein